MGSKRHKPEEIVSMLRQVDVLRPFQPLIVQFLAFLGVI